MHTICYNPKHIKKWHFNLVSFKYLNLVIKLYTWTMQLEVIIFIIIYFRLRFRGSRCIAF